MSCQWGRHESYLYPGGKHFSRVGPRADQQTLRGVDSILTFEINLLGSKWLKHGESLEYVSALK